MKELLKNKKHTSWREVQNLILLDTCFIIDCVKLNKKIKIKNVAITSFNIEELLKVSHRLGHLKKGIRNFIKNTSFLILCFKNE